MTDAPPFVQDTSSGDAGELRNRLEWEVPEVGAVVVLVTCGLLALGGLVGGVLESSGSSYGSGLFKSQFTGAAITVGASWASSLLALALLVVVGVCWWQSQAWDDARESERDVSDELEALGHIARARRICMWAIAALAVTFAGSVALFVGTIWVSGPGDNAQSWSRWVVTGANALAVTAISYAASWVGHQFIKGPVPATVER